MIEFARAWELFEIGDALEISDGTLEPDQFYLEAYNAWLSHNSRGRLAAKIDLEPRAMIIEIINQFGNVIGYTIKEGGPDRFKACPGSPMAAHAFEIEAAIRTKAEALIYKNYPVHAQINDLADANAEGRAERLATKDTLRAWANDLITQAKAASSEKDLDLIRAQIEARKN
jgi:hypothetical protein